MKINQKPPKSLDTVAASYGVATDRSFGAVAPPVYLSSTYAFQRFESPGPYDYGRSGNPSRDMLSDALAELEGGAGAIVTSSGMAALDLALSILQPGDLLIAPHDCYGGTYRLLSARAKRGHFAVEFLDQSNAATLQEAFKRKPTMILVESPSNPLMRVVDITQVSSWAKQAGALVAVDNTFLSPAFQRPLSLGADLVIHSTTKYLNGHSDVIGGAVVVADTERAQELRAWANIIGCTGSPFDAWLTLRGLRTLFPRVERQARNASNIARFLSNERIVTATHYPGLESHPGHMIASQQQCGFGAMLSFEINGGLSAVRDFIDALEIFTLAESLGGVESLVSHPKTMTHADMSEEAWSVAGITDGLIRLSVGLENEEDLIGDLKNGLNAIGDF